AHLGLRPGDQLLGNIQNSGLQVIRPGQLGHRAEHIVFQFLYMCLKYPHVSRSFSQHQIISSTFSQFDDTCFGSHLSIAIIPFLSVICKAFSENHKVYTLSFTEMWYTARETPKKKGGCAVAKHKLSQLPKMDRLLAREELAG